jgi:phosphosulfolactate synthase (CoM biosynthesis protein A)
MKINLRDEDLREYVKQQLDAGVRSIVRSEVATLINQEMAKKLKDVTPHSLQIAINGQIEKEAKRVIEEAFHTLNTHGIDSQYRSWNMPVLFIQKIVWSIRDQLKDILWKHVSSKVGMNLDTHKREER